MSLEKLKSGYKDKKIKKKTGHLFILSAPSGAGKTTLLRAIRNRIPEMLYSVSYTTRKPRRGEKNGIDYYFITKAHFEQKIDNDEWAEWAVVHGNYYGTPAAFLSNGLISGHDIFLDIDVQGATQILKRYPDSITIFIMPPSLETLKHRLEQRGTDSEEMIKRRLANAKKELALKDIYQHIIINDTLSEAIEALVSVVVRYT